MTSLSLKELLDELQAEASANNEYDNREPLERARKAVLGHVASLIDAERERCAKVLETVASNSGDRFGAMLVKVAAEIRRGG